MTQSQNPSTAMTTSPGGSTAVATREETAQDLAVLNIAGRADVERIETIVTIPADFQYKIKQKGQKIPGTDRWEPDTYKVGLAADAYDYLNRVVGCSFFLPEWVHDEQGRQQRNPIHRKDYIYLRLAGIWYTPLGQLVMATEDVEVDFHLTWMDARINSFGAEVITDAATGQVLFDNAGNPALRLTPKDELKALKTLSQLRTFGPRYAQTVARVRLLKMATGVRSLPIPEPKAFPIRVVGYRDKMTPQDRIAKAGGDLSALYGGSRPDNIAPLTVSDLADIGPDIDADTERLDREAVTAQQTDPATPITAPWSAAELADLDEDQRQ